ncbi:MAG: amidohydrolase [Oscillospiraceae bacterium]|nr:amidohydrolase [Oscillospiraceae bacterium]
MKADFLAEAEAAANEISALREAIHRRPELGNRERETAALVENTLRGYGIETYRPLDTAVVGVLRGGRPGAAVALRAELDALPVAEATGAAFASACPGVMHACGHDVHMAAALGAARLLSRRRAELAGTVRFFFQPDEEGRGGARRMIDAGCMGDTEAVFGCHVDPALPLGVVGIRYGKFYAASDCFSVTLRGRGAHGAQRDKGIDALAAAAELVTALLRLPEALRLERAVLTVGTLRAGTAENIIPGLAELSGMFRTLGTDNRETLREALRQTVEAVSAAHGTQAELELRPSYSGVVNTEAETALAQRAAEALLGPERVVLLREPLMTTEDFGCFVDAAAGSFYHIGAGCASPLHAPDFLPAPRAAVLAAALHAAVLWDYLNHTRE